MGDAATWTMCGLTGISMIVAFVLFLLATGRKMGEMAADIKIVRRSQRGLSRRLRQLEMGTSPKCSDHDSRLVDLEEWRHQIDQKHTAGHS